MDVHQSFIKHIFEDFARHHVVISYWFNDKQKRFGPCPHKAHGPVEKTGKKANEKNNYSLLKLIRSKQND